MKPYFETDLGKLYNCDCLEFMQTMEDKSVDLVLTDPPYGIGADKKNAHSSIRDNHSWSSFNWDIKPIKIYFSEMLRISKNQMIWGANYFSDYLPPSSGWLCWRKPEAETGFSLSDVEFCWTSLNMSSRCKTINRRDGNLHPTQKPIQIIKWCLDIYGISSNFIFDPFIGSGTTAVACEQLGRRWIGCEISERYAEIAARRIEREYSQVKMVL